MLGDFELRFFEIYRSAQYLELLARGAATSILLAVSGGAAGLALATALASVRFASIPVLAPVAT